MQFKDLYQIAKKELGDIPNLVNSDFRLEQVQQQNNDKGGWEIVVSYLVKNDNKEQNPLSSLIEPFERIYKRVKINNHGKVEAFFMHNN